MPVLPGIRAADRAWAWAAHVSMVQTFIASFDRAPAELVLDFDATDDAMHGRQVGGFFHGYYDHYCFLPEAAYHHGGENQRHGPSAAG
jgi:hypothetical protein